MKILNQNIDEINLNLDLLDLNSQLLDQLNDLENSYIMDDYSLTNSHHSCRIIKDENRKDDYSLRV